MCWREALVVGEGEGPVLEAEVGLEAAQDALVDWRAAGERHRAAVLSYHHLAGRHHEGGCSDGYHGHRLARPADCHGDLDGYLRRYCRRHQVYAGRMAEALSTFHGRGRDLCLCLEGGHAPCGLCAPVVQRRVAEC